MSTSKLFSPVKVGTLALQHRVVFAPVTRFRASAKEHVPQNPMMQTYYAQRASYPGTLLITEATLVSPQAGGFDGLPGIWSKAQVAAWKEITDAVHARGSYIYLQMYALGRTAKPAVLAADGLDHVAPSSITIGDKYPTPRALAVPEIQQYIQDYAQAAHSAVHGAGFDGVEVHCANGFLLDQFLQDVSNTRTDAYGGSVEGRSRFPLEIVDGVVKAIGAERTGVRVSPWNKYQGMRMADPRPQFSHFVSNLRAAHPELAYLHFTESDAPSTTEESNDFLRQIWAPKPLISANNYTRETAIARAEEEPGELIAFGRYFVSNPDLVRRLEKDIPLAPFHIETFYKGGEKGYIDYPFVTDTQE